jgi:transketolase
LRREFQEVVSEMMLKNDELVLLLGDIGVYGFRGVLEQLPERALNMGILEQGMTSFAAGLALEGKIPILHSITPFLIERPFEQIKLDFGYQRLPGKFISVGGSFDYSALGASHHSPGDVSLLLTIPGFKIYLPATKNELKLQLRSDLNQRTLSYFRLTEEHITLPFSPEGPVVSIKKQRNTNLILALGSSIREGLSLSQQLEVDLVYLNEISKESLQLVNEMLNKSDYLNVALLQPFYSGSVSFLLQDGLQGKKLTDIGVPREYIHHYGSIDEIKHSIGMSEAQLRTKLETFFGH